MSRGSTTEHNWRTVQSSCVEYQLCVLSTGILAPPCSSYLLSSMTQANTSALPTTLLEVLPIQCSYPSRHQQVCLSYIRDQKPNSILLSLHLSPPSLLSFLSPGPPFFLVYPSPVMAVNGSLIFLDCLAGGEPEPTISWLKDFTAINLTFSDNIVLEANGTLVIMEAEFEDTGFYTCVADNGLGINQVSVPVEVIPEITINKTGLYTRK